MVVCPITNSIFLNLGMEMANSSMINATMGKSSLSIFLARKRKKKGKGKNVYIFECFKEDGNFLDVLTKAKLL